MEVCIGRRGLRVSWRKTEYMCVNEKELQEEELKKVKELKYLGSEVQSNGKCDGEVRHRIQAGWQGWRKVSGVLCDKRLSARVKGRVCKTAVRLAMTCSLETVALNRRHVNELELAELKMMRWALGVTILDRRRSDFIKGTGRITKFGKKVRSARLRWFGQVKRLEEGCFGKRVLKMKLP